MTTVPTKGKYTATTAAQILREFTRTPADRGIVTMLIRAAVASPAAAGVLVVAPLRTRANRHAAVIAAGAAIASEMDEATGGRAAEWPGRDTPRRAFERNPLRPLGDILRSRSAPPLT